MNYTGNPRRLRSNPRFSQRTLLHRQRLRTHVITERPQLDICQNFQTQTNHSTSESQSVATSSTNGSDSFEAKRRRLLQQKDWLGLDLSAPIKIYDIRDAKERKRLANGPFIKPISYHSTELDSTGTSASRTSQTPRSPTITSKSSTSLRPEPTIPSIHSSDNGIGFIPSQQSSPLLAQKGSPTTKSTSSKTSWNPFLGAKHTPVSDVPFIPEATEEVEDVEFFTRTKSADKDLDMRPVWNLVEERKKEDRLLRAQFGWRSCSESGVSGSEPSQRDSASQSRDPSSNDGQCDQLALEHCSAYGSKRPSFSTFGQTGMLPPLQTNQLSIADDGPLSRSAEISGGRKAVEVKRPVFDEPDHDASNTSIIVKQAEPLSILVQEVQHCLADKPITLTKKVIEDEDDDDEGIPWF